MSRNSQISLETDLQQLLEAAERDCRQDQSSSAFRHALLRQMLIQWSVPCVRLWDQRADMSAVCCVVSGESLPPPPAEDISRAAPGVVDVVRVPSAATDAAPSVRMLTAASVTDSVRLVLEVVAEREEIPHPFLTGVCDILADIQRRILLAGVLQRERALEQSRDLVALLHADLNADRVANTLASDAVGLFGCARVAVCRRSGTGGWVVVAVTGVASPNDRAEDVRELARSVAIAEEPAVPFAGSSVPSPKPAVEGSSEAGPLVIPLTVRLDWPGCTWAAVIESADPVAVDRQVVGYVCRHAAVALRNCDSHRRSSPLARLLRAPRQIASARPLLTIAGVGIVAVWLLLLPTELQIECHGRLVPSAVTRVFTPDSGIISRVNIADGMDVTGGQELGKLRNDEVELELETVTGELAAAEARLAAIESMKGTTSVNRDATLVAEAAELGARVDSLRQQRAILSARHSHLTLIAPINGRIYTEITREQLEGRPVQRGQYLFDIADPHSAWQLKLDLPEADSRHVLAALAEAPALRISYTIETSPEVMLETTTDDISEAVCLSDQGQLVLRVVAPHLAPLAEDQRPGSGVVARLQCGQRLRGYVYFRRFIELLQRRQWL